MATILIVEDDNSTRRLVDKVITKYFPEETVISVPGGIEALSVLKTEPIDIVISDIGNTEMTGVELLRVAIRIRHRLVFIVLSGCGSWDAMADVRRIGAFAYISKPFERDALTRIVKAGLEEAQHRRDDQFIPCEEFHIVATFRSRAYGVPTT